MDEKIIAWNVTNWVTVILMAAVGFFVMGIVLKWWSARTQRKTPTLSGLPVYQTTTAGAASLA